MNLAHSVASLGLLQQLRQRELDALDAEQAGHRAQAERCGHNIARMHQLLVDVGRSSANCPVMASNSAHYKASLVDLIAGQRRELLRQQDAIEAGRKALLEAGLRRERVAHSLKDKQAQLQQQQRRDEQKRQDLLATQAWVHARLCPSPI